LIEIVCENFDQDIIMSRLIATNARSLQKSHRLMLYLIGPEISRNYPSSLAEFFESRSEMKLYRENLDHGQWVSEETSRWINLRRLKSMIP
jgi:hypothetical protein